MTTFSSDPNDTVREYAPDAVRHAAGLFAERNGTQRATWEVRFDGSFDVTAHKRGGHKAHTIIDREGNEQVVVVFKPTLVFTMTKDGKIRSAEFQYDLCFDHAEGEDPEGDVQARACEILEEMIEDGVLPESVKFNRAPDEDDEHAGLVADIEYCARLDDDDDDDPRITIIEGDE